MLDFGRQFPTSNSTTGWGAIDFHGDTIPDKAVSGYQSLDIVTTLEDYANGWRYCNNSVPLWLGLGTNNCGVVIPSLNVNCPTNYVGATTGADWGSLVQGLALYYSGTNIHARGATDAELEYNTASITTSWVGGSNPVLRGGSGSVGFQGSAQVYFDYGDATGCLSGSCGAAGGPAGWSGSAGEQAVYDIVYGFAGAVGFPQVYSMGAGNDWATVATDGGGGYPYSSALATPTLDTPATAWSDLGKATSQYPVGAASTIENMP